MLDLEYVSFCDPQHESMLIMSGSRAPQEMHTKKSLFLLMIMYVSQRLQILSAAFSSSMSCCDTLSFMKMYSFSSFFLVMEALGFFLLLKKKFMSTFSLSLFLQSSRL